MATSKDKKKTKRKPTDESGVPEAAYDDTGSAFTGPSFTEGLVSPQHGTGGGMFPPEMWNYLRSLPQETPSEYAITKAKIADPVRLAQQTYQARLASDPWGPGGQFEGRRAADLYTPEQIVASGGMTAENQLRSQQKKTDEFDPEELRRLNEQYKHSYV